MIFAFLIQCAVSFVSVVAFAVLFHAPRQEWAWCGLTGMAGWAAYWLLVQMEQGVVTASLVAAVVLALLSRILAVVRRCPMTVFIMGGIFPLVPGAGIYYTVYYFIMGEEGQCLAKGVETLKNRYSHSHWHCAGAGIAGGFVPAVGVQVAKDTVKSCFAEVLQKNGMTIGSCRF